MTSRKRSPRSFEAEPSTPRPTRTPASSRFRTGATPAPSRRFEVGQCATPVPDSANRAMSPSSRWTQCAHQTSPSSQPSCSRYSTGRQPYSSWQYASSSTVSARCVCSCSPSRRASSADSRISRPGDREGRARRDHQLRVAIGEPLGLGQHLVGILDELVRWQAAVGFAEVHRAARGDQPHAQLARRGHLRLDEVAAAAREDVVVVEHRRAAGERELGKAGLRGRVLGLGVDPRPDGIEGLQPGEEVGLLGAGARERLVQVVVGVDEAGSDEGAAEILAVVRLRLGTAADLAHDAVLDQHPARLVLGARDRPSRRRTRWRRVSSRVDYPTEDASTGHFRRPRGQSPRGLRRSSASAVLTPSAAPARSGRRPRGPGRSA